MSEPLDADILEYDEEGGFGSWLMTLLRICAVAFIVLLVFWSMLFRPFRIPSGSMVPTLEVGDHIFVSMLDYGLHVPIIDTNSSGFLGILPLRTTEVISWSEPARGDVIVFRYPPDPKVDYIKRIVGLPGDTVEVHGGEVSINGAPAPRTFVEEFKFVDDACRESPAKRFSEDLAGVAHAVLASPFTRLGEYGPVTVPEGHFFVMGDNRDNSSDSRVWGFVPRDHVIGKASRIWLSWNTCQGNIPQIGSFRLNRIAQRIE
jgi:signal peptidase I